MMTPILVKVAQGSLTLPPQVQETLGMSNGGFLLLHVEEGRLIGDAVDEHKATEPRQSVQEIEEAIADVKRLTGSMPELRGAVEELIAERARERW